MFVDVHSHVVPSGDDGVGSIEEGLELCREAARRGTRVLVATPHVWPHLTLTPAREEEIRRLHAAMARDVAAVGLDLQLGFELTPARTLLDDDLRRYRLGTIPAVLVELPFTGPLDLAERVAEEIEAAELTPVLAHPERADMVIADPGVARAYHERGWLLQVNATSLLGRHGADAEEVGWFLVEAGAADLIGSDGHRARRPPFLDEAFAVARERVGEEANQLFDGSALRALPARRGADLAQRS